MIILLALFGGCFATEYATFHRLVPSGRFATLNEYLAYRPSAQRFAIVDHGGSPHVIAYGPSSSLLLSSGSSAYVFDNSGRLVEWSADMGDDPAFDEKWTAQASSGPNHSMPRSEIEQIATTQPAS